jgi:2-polyprenyl-6-methoxyphenol hydroxylase-like FAD-dependent oxidoreductase
MKVGIVGCGTAGAAVAIMLARQGAEVSVFERVPSPKPFGAGIMLQPTGQAVLARMGLLQPIAERGARIDRLWFRTPSGRTIVDLQYAAIDRGWHAYGIHRGLLFDTLYAAACRAVSVSTGCEMRGLRRDGASTYLVCKDGSERGPFDLIIIADGAVSELRAAAGTTKRDAQYPWGALWFVADDPDGVYTRELYQIGVRSHRLYGVLPTGKGPHGETPVVSLFWSLPVRDVEAWRQTPLETWKAEVRALDPRIDLVLDKITDHAQVTFARYRDVQMTRWHDHGVVFIGDAAHATSPQLGQGANLALVDACVLADSIRISSSIDAALELYASQRRKHLRFYQRMTCWLTPFFQSDHRLLGWLRDWTFPIANAIPPLRNHMIKTMAGVSTGFARRRFELPPGL